MDKSAASVGGFMDHRGLPSVYDDLSPCLHWDGR